MPHPSLAAGVPVPVPRLHAALFPPFGGSACGVDVAECPPWQSPLINLPLDERHVRAALAELRAMDADAMTAALNMTAKDQTRDTLPAHEAAALARFTGQAGLSAALSKETPENLTRQAQHLLLMVWTQEERVLDIHELSRRYSAGEARLAALLGDKDDSGTALQPNEASPLADDLLILLPPWAFVLDLLSRFLPENALLCVTDAALAQRLLTCTAPEPLGDGLFGARARLSHVFGRAAAKDGEYLFLIPHELIS